MRPDPYRILGVPSGASLDEAEDAYHRLLRQEHPDLHHTAGPERVADAERRTRELNAAISAIRDAETIRTAAGASRDGGRGATGAAAGAAPGGGAHRGAGEPSEPAAATGTRDDPSGEWRAPTPPPPTAACPWCGERFDRPTELKDHVLDGHHLRIDRPLRGGLFGGRFHRWMRTASHLPLWGVIPVNLLLATVIGLLVTLVADEVVGRWAFAVAMAPTITALVDWVFDRSR